MRRIAFAADPRGDQGGRVKEGCLDYISAEVKADAYGRLFLTLELAQPPPRKPSHDIGYIWRIDTDLASSPSGQRVNDIGSDFNIRICYYPGKTQGWEVDLDEIGSLPCPFWVDPRCWWDGNRVTVELLLLSDPPEANLRAAATMAVPEPYRGDEVPDHSHLDISFSPDGAARSSPVYLLLRQVAHQPSNTRLRERLAQAFASAGMATDAARELAKLNSGALLTRTGSHVELRFPEWFGEKPEPRNLVAALDRTYAFMRKLTGYTPWNGDVLVFSYSESVPQNAAYAGNPVNVGVQFWRADRQDLTAALLHEMGHSFTCLGQAPLARWLRESSGFTEALASLLGTRCARAVADETQGRSEVGMLMARVYRRNSQMNHEEAQRFLAQPPGHRDPASLVPLHHWAFLRVMEATGWDAFDHFLAVFSEAARSGRGIGQLQPRTVAQKNAVLAAVLDLSAGRCTSSDWPYLGIPLDQGFYRRTTRVLTGRGVAAR